MEIAIDNKRSFQFIQHEFNRQYPFLKIDFIRPCIGDARPSFRAHRIQGTINIDGQRTVDQTIKDFEDAFGFSMVMFRRSVNVWIETSLTEDWTLERQNREGESISRIT